MKIALVVHGRFHAFDLARALIRRGHAVTVFTNYPKWVVKRFGLDSGNVESFWIHGIVSRIVGSIPVRRLRERLAACIHRSFGEWAARAVSRRQWDIVHVFSGVAEEILQSPAQKGTVRQLARGSAHIRVQAALLEEEARRVGRDIDQPGQWMIAREEREYALADRIVVLSTFAYRSFLDQGVPAEKLRLLSLGVETRQFRPEPAVLEARCKRIMEGAPLRVLMVGTLSYQKGVHDLAQVVHTLRNERFHFRFVGDVPPEARTILATIRDLIEVIPRQPQSTLPKWYADSDLFMFPTVQDGFAVVLTQAYAGALPILTTPNCSGPDLIVDGETGWILPIRDAEAFVERLRWCDAHRDEVVAMVKRLYHNRQPRDWDQVAETFEQMAGQPPPAQSGFADDGH